MFKFFGRIAALSLSILVVFYMIVIHTLSNSEKTIRSLINTRTSEFVQQVTRNGELTRKAYNDYVKFLDSTGYLLKIEMKQSHLVYEPVTDTPVAGSSSDDVTTDTDAFWQDVCKDEIIFDLQSENAKHVFSQGDYFYVKVYNQKNTLLTSLQNPINNNVVHSIVVECGGTVRDEKS